MQKSFLQDDSQQIKLSQSDSYLQNYCKIPGHEDQKILFLCLKKDCEMSSRQMCMFCMVSSGIHDISHKQYTVFIQQVMNQSDNFFIKNWPQNDQIKIIYQSVNEQLLKNEQEFQQQIQNLDDNFKSFTEQVLESLKIIKSNIKQTLKQKHDKSRQIQNDLIQQICQNYSLDYLRNQYLDLDSKTIDSGNLETNVKRFCKHIAEIEKQEKQMEQTYQKLLTHNILKLDFQNFNQYQSTVLKNILCMEDKLVEKSQLIKFYEYNTNLVEIRDNQYTFSKVIDQQIIISQNDFNETDQVQIRFKISKFLVSYTNLIFGICDADCKTNNFYTSKRIEINLFSNEENKNFQREGHSLKKILKEVKYYLLRELNSAWILI